MKENNISRTKAVSQLELAVLSLEDQTVSPSQRLELFSDAAKMLDDAKADLIDRASAWNGVGICLHRLGGEEKAEERAFAHALKLLRRHSGEQNDELMATVLGNLGECMSRSGSYGKAAAYYADARDIYLRSGDAERYALYSCSLARCTAESGNVALAERQLSEAVGKLKKLRATRNSASQGECICWGARGLIRFQLGRFRAARRDFLRACKAGEQQESYSGAELSGSYYGLGRAAEALGRLDEAAEAVLCSAQLLILNTAEPSDELYTELAGRTFSLGDIYESDNKPELAARYYSYAANFLACCSSVYCGELCVPEREALCRYAAAGCLCRSENQLYYDAMLQYNQALRALDRLGPEAALEHRQRVLDSRADIFEAFGENELAMRDYSTSLNSRSKVS